MAGSGLPGAPAAQPANNEALPLLVYKWHRGSITLADICVASDRARNSLVETMLPQPSPRTPTFDMAEDLPP